MTSRTETLVTLAALNFAINVPMFRRDQIVEGLQEVINDAIQEYVDEVGPALLQEYPPIADRYREVASHLFGARGNVGDPGPVGCRFVFDDAAHGVKGGEGTIGETRKLTPQEKVALDPYYVWQEDDAGFHLWDAVRNIYRTQHAGQDAVANDRISARKATLWMARWLNKDNDKA